MCSRWEKEGFPGLQHRRMLHRHLRMNRNQGGRNYVFATEELSVLLTPLPLLGVFRDLDLAQAFPGRKILLPSLKGGLLVGCNKSSLRLNSGPRWLG